jgi:hypothetical protein
MCARSVPILHWQDRVHAAIAKMETLLENAL